ncbi:MAG: HPr family phosphocarrier protein [Pseudomonadota bacterium]
MALKAKDNERTIETTITNRLGLHARAAARLVQLTERFRSEVFMEKDGQAADVKSVLALLTLDCPMGTRVVLRARGKDAESALSAIAGLVQDKFGEE